MPETTAAPAQVCLLDDGYSREARSLLYNAYRHEPTFAYIFEAQRPGYERRLRVMVREWVRQHFYLQLPAIGLLVDDRLIAMALIVPPVRRLGVADSWAWRLRMILGTGLRCTRRYMDYQAALATCLPAHRSGACVATAGGTSAISGQALRGAIVTSRARLVRGSTRHPGRSARHRQ